MFSNRLPPTDLYLVGQEFLVNVGTALVLFQAIALRRNCCYHQQITRPPPNEPLALPARATCAASARDASPTTATLERIFSFDRRSRRARKDNALQLGPTQTVGTLHRTAQDVYSTPRYKREHPRPQAPALELCRGGIECS